MDTFAARLNASEGSFFRSEQQNATKRHVAKLVEQGSLPKTALEAVGGVMPPVHTTYDIPITFINSRPASEIVFQYNGVPIPRMSSFESWARLGTAKVSLGRGKWSADGASIFSVQDGKRLAQTPPKEPTAWELNRQRKIANAAVDKRVVSGIRLMPEYTPARALFWGSILALWGTGAVVASAAKGLDIHSAEEAAAKLRSVAQPMVNSLAQTFEPYRGWFTEQSANATVRSTLFPVQEVARRMRDKLGHEHHS